MRRASSSLLRSIAKSKFVSRNAPTPPILPLSRHFHHVRHPIPSPKFLSCTIQTSAVTAPPLPSRQRKIKEKSDLEEAFKSATSTDEILTSFAALESTLDEHDKKLGLACLKVGWHLRYSDQEKALGLSLRALKILDCDGEASISVAMALHLASSASYGLNRFNDSLGFLNRASRILDALGREGSGDFDGVRWEGLGIQRLLADTKTAMGRREEALINLRKALELKESLYAPDSLSLSARYRDLAKAYVAFLNFKEALPLCRKALEIHKRWAGLDSAVYDRMLLRVIYVGLEQHEKALEQNDLLKKDVDICEMGADMLYAEIDGANVQIAMEKYDEAIKTLEGVVEKTEEESHVRGLVYVSMANALCHQEKSADAKRCLEIACGIFEKQTSLNHPQVAEKYTDAAALYESMNDFETAISLLKRSLAMTERLPLKQRVEGRVSARIGWLLLLTGKVEQAVLHLESAAERMKERFGPKHFGLGYIYNNLGAAYMKMERPQSAAQMFALAKDIMDTSSGPHHVDSIEACQSLADAYSAMGCSGYLKLKMQNKNGVPIAFVYFKMMAVF